jgi:hypothetical protein
MTNEGVSFHPPPGGQISPAVDSWTDNKVVEADCYSECELTEQDLAELQGGDWPPSGE